jgi:hypothetical protein
MRQSIFLLFFSVSEEIAFCSKMLLCYAKTRFPSPIFSFPVVDEKAAERKRTAILIISFSLFLALSLLQLVSQSVA